MSPKHQIRIMRAAFPDCAVSRGWHLIGAGPARFGWAAIHPSGAKRWLGSTARQAVEMIINTINAHQTAASTEVRS